MKLIRMYLLTVIIVFPNLAGAALLLAEQYYDNGAYASTIFNVDFVNVNGALRVKTSGPGIASPQSFISGSYISASGYTYNFDESAVVSFIDVYVDIPYTDILAGVSTGEVYFHYILDSAQLVSDCLTVQCLNDAPVQLSEIQIYADTAVPSWSVIATSLDGTRVDLAIVPIPPSIILFLSGMVILFQRVKKRTA